MEIPEIYWCLGLGNIYYRVDGETMDLVKESMLKGYSYVDFATLEGEVITARVDKIEYLASCTQATREASMEFTYQLEQAGKIWKEETHPSWVDED